MTDHICGPDCEHDPVPAPIPLPDPESRPILWTMPDTVHPEPIPQTGPMVIPPRPVIGSLPFGGVVLTAGREKGIPLGRVVQLGSAGKASPGAFGWLLWTKNNVGSWELLPDGSNEPGAGLGFELPIGALASGDYAPALWLPVQRLRVRPVVGGGVDLSWAMIGFQTAPGA